MIFYKKGNRKKLSLWPDLVCDNVNQHSGTLLTHLPCFQTDSLSWKYEHDANGNVIKIDFGIGVTVNHFNGSGERIEKIGANHQINYDANGRLASRHDLEFQYDGFGKLTKVGVSITKSKASD